ncbi:Pentatricopeptide repeat-containing protein [Rhynchospora pubera]|uniref:Pentatricopeptide repeat-containing protein n=1 Tax=Rhynchospora pubera TaxID=906938 RepID=A0AAV8F4E5_9POAL|nr:Pentatricopeptide repeat-containing protein [Rhynchospora pubera]
MRTLLHSISPFPSTGKAVTETSRTKPKAFSLPNLKKNSTLPLKKHVCAFSASSHDEISPETTSTAFSFPDLKNFKKVNKKQLTVAYQLFEEMADKGLRPAPSRAKNLIYSLCSHGFVRKAVRVVEIMLRSGTLLSESICTFIIENLTNIGAYEYVIQLLDEMEQRGCTINPDVYRTLTIFLCRKAATSQVWPYLDKLIQKGLAPTNSYVIANLLEAAQRQGGADLAVSVLYQMLLKGWEPNLVCYNNILNAFKKENRASEALELYEALPPHMKSNLITHNILLNALGDQGLWREAEALLDSMMERGIMPNIITYRGLILVIANGGYPDEALEIAEELGRNGFRTDAWCFNPVLTQFSSECRLDMVHKCLESMDRWNCPVNSGTYRAIAVLCDKNMVDEAFGILESLREKQGANLHWFYGKVVLPYLCHKGNTFEAFQILTKLSQVGYAPNSQTVSSFVSGLCMEGLYEEAIEMFEVMDKYNVQPDESNYNKLISGLCDGGRTDLAMLALERMVIKGYEPTESTYVEIIEWIGYQGRRDLAGELLKELFARGCVSEESMEKISLKFCLDEVGV